MVKPEATDDNVGEYGACALPARHLRIPTHFQNINTYCLSTAKIVTFILYVRGLHCLLWQLNNAESCWLDDPASLLFHLCYKCSVSNNVLKYSNGAENGN
jgi:hypothetical protein